MKTEVPPEPSDAEQTAARAAAFIARWTGVTASELATAQSFVADLCELLDVPKPHATADQSYMFERPVTFRHGDGTASAGRIDCYRRNCFVLEAKKLRSPGLLGSGPKLPTKGFDDALLRARSQAEGYARALPASEGRPPFLLVVDVGNVIELYAEFTRSGATYTPFPDPRSHRLALADLARTEVREQLRRIWLDAESLNPARISARVTREVADKLAQLAKSLESTGHPPLQVAAFLTRCLFSMFAEDVQLLPKINGVGSFLGLLQTHQAQPQTLAHMLRVLWADMDRGGFSAALAAPVLRFNGKLFKESNADGYALLMNAPQIDLLIQAAKSNWREVEPAIFGTLLERALDPTERHALGAHYTPRAYVERLVLPTVVQPLRADWADAQAAALVLAQDGKLPEAIAQVRAFHHQLCSLRVLDPACGSGNFLYVTLEHLKRLEGEVINQLEALGQTQSALGLDGETVTLQQLLGIELNPRAAALAELVLWIGYLQWHIRTRGNQAVAEPVVHDYGNITCGDAVLTWADMELARNGYGDTLMRWNGTSFKTHPTTGAQVPDEAAQVPQWRYIRPRKAAWPRADFVVGNPPFIGAGPLRATLGDGYAQTLRATWREVPESADFVMYWWSHAADLVAKGQLRRAGLITTNSLRQTFNRRVVQAAMAQGVELAFAIPDHPWVDSSDGAAVRIAMTVMRRSAPLAKSKAKTKAPTAGPSLLSGEGHLLTLVQELPGEHGEVNVVLTEQQGLIHADLTVGANVSAAGALQANAGISSPGVKLHGAGFIVTPQQATELLPLPRAGEGRGEGRGVPTIIRTYRNGRDLTGTPRNMLVIDLFGLTALEVRQRYPTVYQWVLERVKPERAQNNRATYRNNWWIFGEPRRELRPALAKLPRYIATVETAKHRTFQFLDASILPDNMLIAIASDDAFHLGVLSSLVHAAWSLANGGSIGVYVGNVRYNKTRCFETFPFPDDDTGLTPTLRERIATLAEQIDAHRKRQQAAHPSLTLTGVYNVLEALRAGTALTDKEKTIHAQGLVAVLKELHDELDAAVLTAYGLQHEPPTHWLHHLVSLNAQRAEEERTGSIRWLRPAYQNPALRAQTLADKDKDGPQSLSNEELPEQISHGLQTEMALEMPELPAPAATPMAWPATLPSQVRAVAQLLAASTHAMPLGHIEAQFKGRGAWKRSLPRILETLEVLGRARREELGWRGA